MVLLKLTSRNDSKHDKAHEGMKSVTSDPRSNGYEVEDDEDAEVVVVALMAKTGIVKVHSNSNPVRLAASILWNNIYLLIDEDIHVSV